MAPVGPIIAYGLMVLSAGFYCGFDTVLKKQSFESFNKSTDVVFNEECEAYECLGKTLKMYENGKMLEEGFSIIAGVLTGFNSSQIEVERKEFQTCLFQANEKLNGVPRCSKFQTGMKLLELCLDKKHRMQFHATKFNFGNN